MQCLVAQWLHWLQLFFSRKAVADRLQYMCDRGLTFRVLTSVTPISISRAHMTLHVYSSPPDALDVRISTRAIFPFKWYTRISYKILLLTYKALNGHAPQYLAALISKYVPPRPLRSGDEYLPSSPRWRLETFGKRAFSKAARPDPLEPSTPQREVSSIYWLFQDHT